MSRIDKRLVPIPPEHREQVSRLIADLGTVETSRRLGIGANTCLRVAATGYAQRGTAALLREAFAPRQTA